MRVIERNGKKEIYDPIRKKYVVLTPEEQVRQFVIGFLCTQCQVPAGYISVETGLQVYGNFFRTDLRVRNKKGEAVLLVECKRPSVALDQEVLEQAMRYHIATQERFVIITNGAAFKCLERSPEGDWRSWERYPSWEEMCR
ncbi:MAG: type I restriction enzyme HsdR N-terminal domain-containing protein [Bacteroides sp.]|nr:type I restriction enzyme HsdR N-terminal domain-containing protein [Ruminococcus flavefaciens]MCM1555412.1 type I restriction enzyme HsdR N-terminal domain-containing protein [Bacteroides sp.]